MDLASVLEAARVERGLSINELARRADLSPGRVHAILRGQTPNPGILTVQAILAALGLELDTLSDVK